MTPPPIFLSVGAELGISSRKKPVSEFFSSLHAVYEAIVCIELKSTENRGLQLDDPLKKGV